MRRATLLALGLLLVPQASAATEEFDLPAGWDGPTHLTFDERGTLWITLDGAWALGRWDTGAKTGAMYRLSVPKPPDGALGGIDVAPDGTVWLGTPDHLVRFFPGNSSFQNFPLPLASIVSGDVRVAPDGSVWYALTSADVLLKLDPSDGSSTTFPLPNQPFGPLEFKEDPAGGFYLTATYANTYARYDPAASGLAIGRASVAGPVGIDQAPDARLWIAEMGASSVSRVEHATGALERYPTSHSPYYPASGPAGLYVHPDGSVWFAEHFADRISRLDPNAKTLHEYEVPSAPGTNLQFLAPADDGSVWFAEFSKNKIGRATFTNEPVASMGPANITLAAGETIEIDLPGADATKLIAAGPDETINATIANGKLVVKATANAAITQAADGGRTGAATPYVLLSTREGKLNAGRYIPLTITAAENASPLAPFGLLAGAILLAALVTRRAR